MADNDNILPLESPGVKRYIWDINGNQILIEVFDDGRILVNQSPVELAEVTKKYLQQNTDDLCKIIESAGTK